MKTNSVLHGLLLLLGFSLLFACKSDTNTDASQEAVDESEEMAEEPAPLRDVMYVVHEVNDYTAWKQGFDDHESGRVENGVHTIGVGKNLKNPNKSQKTPKNPRSGIFRIS